MSKKRRREKSSPFKGKVATHAKEVKQRGSSYGYLKLPKDIKVYNVSSGRQRLDIIPYVISDEKHMDRDDEKGIAMPGDLWYRKPFKTHRNIGAENETVICLSTFGEKCFICEYRSKLISKGSDKEETDALRASWRSLYVIVPKGHKKYDETLHIFDISDYCFQSLLNDELEENEEFETFPDLENGQTLYCRFEEEKLGKNKFQKASRIDFEEREEQYDESILEDVPDLDKMLSRLTYKEMQALFMELDEDDMEDENIEDVDEDEERETVRKKHIVRKKHKPEPEEDEDEDEDEDENSKKKIHRRKHKPKSEPDEDEDEDASETDEDEEEPRRRKKSSSKKSSSKKERCPHNHRFGVDADDYEDCEDCEIWEDCIDVKEENEE